MIDETSSDYGIGAEESSANSKESTSTSATTSGDQETDNEGNGDSKQSKLKKVNININTTKKASGVDGTKLQVNVDAVLNNSYSNSLKK